MPIPSDLWKTLNLKKKPQKWGENEKGKKRRKTKQHVKYLLPIIKPNYLFPSVLYLLSHVLIGL